MQREKTLAEKQRIAIFGKIIKQDRQDKIFVDRNLKPGEEAVRVVAELYRVFQDPDSREIIIKEATGIGPNGQLENTETSGIPPEIKPEWNFVGTVAKEISRI